MRRLFIIARDKALRRALRDYIALTGIAPLIDNGPDLFDLHPPQGAAVVTSAVDMAPGAVAYLSSGHGAHLLVLAPIPNDFDRNQYEQQGALYVPMTVDRDVLMPPLLQVLG
ncbi:MAG: hypothetical protein AB7N24_14540 [Dehalococcoidia bacterium]